MTPLRLGFVGAGTMGQVAHLRNYVTLDDCQVLALAELRPNLAENVARRYGIPKVYANHREMIQQERSHLDALVCIQPFTQHGSLLPGILAAGLPILTEKPLANSLATGEQLLARQRETGGKWFVAYHKRSDPAVMWARRKIDEWKTGGAMGTMRYVRITMPPGDWIAGGFTTLLRSDESQPAGRSDPAPRGISEERFKMLTEFVNYYIHQVNLLRHLLGEPYRVAWADPAGVLLVGRSASGVTGVLEMGSHRTTLAWQETALVCFEKGWIRIDLPAPLAVDRPGRVVVYSDPGGGAEPQRVEPQLPWIHAMRRQAMNFLQAVRGESTPLAGAAEALEDLRIAQEWLDMYKRA